MKHESINDNNWSNQMNDKILSMEIMQVYIVGIKTFVRNKINKFKTQKCFTAVSKKSRFFLIFFLMEEWVWNILHKIFFL